MSRFYGSLCTCRSKSFFYNVHAVYLFIGIRVHKKSATNDKRFQNSFTNALPTRCYDWFHQTFYAKLYRVYNTEHSVVDVSGASYKHVWDYCGIFLCHRVITVARKQGQPSSMLAQWSKFPAPSPEHIMLSSTSAACQPCYFTHDNYNSNQTRNQIQ